MPAPEAGAGAGTGTDGDQDAKQSLHFLFFYALAVAGGTIGYIPFLTLLLPVQASRQFGGDALNVIAYAAFTGAIAASCANIGFGWLSDITRRRRPWIAAGMLLSSALMALMPYASSVAMLIAMIVVWQLFLNMMLAPLGAWAGDCVPDAQKGLLGGFLAFAPALGALSGTIITLQGFATAQERHLAIALLVIVLVTPALFVVRPVQMPTLQPDYSLDQQSDPTRRRSKGDATRMWLARLFVQIAEASLFAFLLLWFRSVEPGFRENDVANIFTAVLGVAVVFAIIVGRWSDRTNRPILPLAICALVGAVGLAIMAIASTLAIALLGYVIFGLASSIFLALHSSQTLRVLPSAQHRGRDLGVFNLTNTVPSLVMPWLTLALVPVYGFDALFLLLATLAIVAFILLLTMALAKKADDDA
jgi:MFS family permease